MPATTKKGQFDVLQFRKYVRYMDSDSEGERNAALMQALRECAANAPPLLFCEAVALAFGGGQDHQKLVDENNYLSERANELEAKLTRRESEAASLADQFLAAQETIARLSKNGSNGQEEGNHTVQELMESVKGTWNAPQMRLFLVTILCMGQVCISWAFKDHPNRWLHGILQFTLTGCVLWLFSKWASLQFARDGVLPLIVKSIIFAAGWSLSYLSIADHWTSWDELMTNGGPSAVAPGLALFFLPIYYLLTISRVSNWFIDDVLGAFMERVVRRAF